MFYHLHTEWYLLSFKSLEIVANFRSICIIRNMITNAGALNEEEGKEAS